MGACLRPDYCSDKAQRVSRAVPRAIRLGEGELDFFRDTPVEDTTLDPSGHADTRQFQREFYWREMVEVVRETGEVIDRTYNEHSESVIMRLLAYVKLDDTRFQLLLAQEEKRRGARLDTKTKQQFRYRPCHVVVAFKVHEPTQWTVVTCYDPNQEEYRHLWTDDLRARRCFCKSH